MLNQNYVLNMIPAGLPVRVPVSQYDDASRDIVFNLISGDVPFSVPSGADVTCDGTKPDGFAFMAPASFSGNTVTVTITEQMAAVAGDAICQITIRSGGAVLGSANFILTVEKGPIGDGSIVSDSDMNAIAKHANDAIRSSQEAAASEAAAAQHLSDVQDVVAGAAGTITTLEQTIQTATEKNTTLSGTIGDAEAAKEALDGSKTAADESKSGLDSSIEAAGPVQAALDASIGDASEIKEALDGSKTAADESKAALDKANETAGGLKTALDALLQAGSDLGADLDNSIQTGAEIVGALEAATEDANAAKSGVEQATQTGADLKTELDAANKRAENNVESLNARGISSITRTSGTGEPGTTDVYTITYTDGTTSEYEVKNGANGTDGKTAYQYAQEGGYTGSEEEFAAKLAAEYQMKITASGLLKGDGKGGVSAAVAGTDYLKTAPVTSVNDKTGAVSLTASDVGADASGTAIGLANRSTAANAADTNYTTLMFRGESLHPEDTTPTVNGGICWTYK